MAYKVKLTALAEADAYAAFERIRAASPTHAERWLTGLFQAMLSLDEMPTRCPLIPEAEEIGRDIRQLPYGKRSGIQRIISRVTNIVITSGNPANLCRPSVIYVTERIPATSPLPPPLPRPRLQRINSIGFPSSTHVEFGTIPNTLPCSKRFPAVSRVFFGVTEREEGRVESEKTLFSGAALPSLDFFSTLAFHGVSIKTIFCNGNGSNEDEHGKDAA